MKTVWITGALGFTGHYLIAHLRKQTERLRLVGLDVVEPKSGETADELDVYQQVDLLDSHALQELAVAEPPTLVFHLAGLMPPHKLDRLRAVNVEGSQHLLNALVNANCADVRFISIGSAAEYTNVTAEPVCESAPAGGDNDYGISKSEQTQWLLEQGLKQGLETIVARPFNIIGPGLSEQLVAGRICRTCLGSADGTIKLGGSTSAQRDFVDIRDVVAAYWVLATAPQANGIYNVSTGVGTRIDALVSLFGDALDQQFTIDAPPQERFSESIVVGDSSRLQALGWQPEVSLGQSVTDMISAQRDRGVN